MRLRWKALDLNSIKAINPSRNRTLVTHIAYANHLIST